MSEPILYIIARNDMESLNPGKLAAQVAHAASMFHERMKSSENSYFQTLFLEWMENRDFGTTIVLEADHSDFFALEDNFATGKHNTMYDIVIDPTYPFFVNRELFTILKDEYNGVVLPNGKYLLTRVETTCMYVFGEKEDCSNHLSHLKLYP